MLGIKNLYYNKTRILLFIIKLIMLELNIYYINYDIIISKVIDCLHQNCKC